MFSLFYLDIQVEKEADAQVETYLSQWLENNHAQVKSHSYHVLRDQLNLKKLNFNWKKIRFNATQVQVQLDHVDTEQLKSIVFKGLQVALPDNKPMFLVKDISFLLPKVSQLKLEQAEVYLAKKTWLQDVDLSVVTLKTKEKKLKASFSMGSGKCWLEGLWVDDHFSSLSLRWHNTDISNLLVPFDFDKILTFKSNGQLHWKSVDDVSDGSSFYGKLEGDSGVLKIEGEHQKGKWKIAFDSANFQISPFINYVPPFLGRKVTNGRITGLFHVEWKEEGKYFLLKSDDLTLAQLELHDTQNNKWFFSSVRTEQLTLSNAFVGSSKIWLNQAHLTVTPDVFSEPQSLLAEVKRASEVNFIDVNELTLLAQLPEGKVTLPTFSGKGSFKDDVLHFDVTHESAEGEWSVDGSWNVVKPLLVASIDVQKAPLPQFRPLLSQVWYTDKKGRTELQGRVDLKMKLKATDHKVRLSGGLQVNDLQILHSGHQWQASLLDIDVEQLGIGLDHQVIRRIQVKDWHYQFALSPIAEPIYLLAKKSSYDWQHWKLGSVDMSGGSVSVARRDATWLSDVTIHLENEGGHDQMQLKLEGLIAKENLLISGTVSPFVEQPRFDIKVRLDDVVPFFLNEWLQFSGIPQLIQGRASAFLHIYRDTVRKEYHGNLRLALERPIFASGTFSYDPFIRLLGFNLKEIIQRMSKDDVWQLEVPLKIPDEYVLSQDIIGQSILERIKMTLDEVSSVHTVVRKTLMEHAIRLHEDSKKDQLSFNERLRLKEVAQVLVQDRRATVILQPQLGNQALTTELKQHIDYTQKRIERLLRYKGVSPAQIFPVWPGAEHRQGDIAGIQVVVQKVVQ
ncbi:MAG: DUF748 domain-containing protein [Mariprofundaceae bacterium]|nr:DUF748 domain-containing protein [Mariprofundaceae bacterium]